MPTARADSRASVNARTEVLTQLKDDHKRVKKAYRDFQKMDADEDPDACAGLVQQVLDELTVHAALEEELLYPAARAALHDEDLVDEAEVEHESMHTLIDQLRGLQPDDEKYAARFTVLCEYVLHHVKEEEGELFPQLEQARLDWPTLASEMAERRVELSPSEDDEEGEAGEEIGDEGTVVQAAAEDEDAGAARGSRTRQRARA